MERAGAEEMPEDAERKGLGTPATRAGIIEKLVSGGFVERKGKSLVPTKNGINLVAVLPEMLTSPMLTAEWEQRLNQIASGAASGDTFMAGISAMASELVQTYSRISEEGQKLFAPEKETVGNCPRCGKPVYEGKKNFSCSDRACGFVLWKDDRFWTNRHKTLTKKMAADLLKKGRTSVKGMWSEKKGAAYDADVILDDTGGKYIDFKLGFPNGRMVPMVESKRDGTFIENLKFLLPEIRDASKLEAVAQMVAGLSQEDRDLLAAVQASPYRLTTLEQLQEFPNNTEYFVLEPDIRGLDELGWRYLAQHMDVLLPLELLDAIDPVPFGKHAMQEEQGCFTSYGYLTLSGDDWEHRQEIQREKKPTIRAQLEQSKKECANHSKPQPNQNKKTPEL